MLLWCFSLTNYGQCTSFCLAPDVLKLGAPFIKCQITFFVI